MNQSFKAGFLLPFAFLLTCTIHSLGQQRNPPAAPADSVNVMKAVDHFVEAFTTLNWIEFTKCFADEATAFFPPSSRFPYRANTKKEIEKIFAAVFDNARKQRSSPPYLDIHPRDVKIQLAGPVAIVTFLLDDPDLLGRRTLVLQKHNEDWLIIHLHASGAALPK